MIAVERVLVAVILNLTNSVVSMRITHSDSTDALQQLRVGPAYCMEVTCRKCLYMHPECDMFDLGRPTWTSGIEGNKMADSMARQEH